jgi:20S proteasome alpha/beta subunit
VTIIVGIVCEGVIILASDSQTTSGTAKCEDARKITELIFSDGKKALVAQAGAVTLSARVVEIMEKLATKTPLSDYRAVADLATTAMRELKLELCRQNLDCTMEELHNWLRRGELECELMLAHYFNGKPYLFTISLSIGIANRAGSHYVAIGCGGNLARYLLSEHLPANADRQLGYAIGVYTVENVKRHDAYCGGPTRIAAIYQFDGDVEFLKQSQIDEFEKAISVEDERTKIERNQSFNRAMLDISNKQIQEWLRAFDDL